MTDFKMTFDEDYEWELNFALGNYIPILSQQIIFTNYSMHCPKHKNK